MLQASMSAEKKVRPMRTPQWSVTLATARQRVSLLKKILSMQRTHVDLNEQVRRISDYMSEDFVYPATVAECSQRLRQAVHEVAQLAKDHDKHREKERVIQIAALEATGDPFDRAHAIKLRQIQKVESSRAVHCKIKNQMKSSNYQSVTRVEVPANPDEDPKRCAHWTVVDVPTDVLETLQRRNRKHFGQAHGTPFTVDPLVGILGYGGGTAEASDVLEGNFDCDSIEHPGAATPHPPSN